MFGTFRLMISKQYVQQITITYMSDRCIYWIYIIDLRYTCILYICILFGKTCNNTWSSLAAASFLHLCFSTSQVLVLLSTAVDKA